MNAGAGPMADGQPASRVAGPGRYRTREPVIVEAIQYTGDNDDAVAAFAGWGWTCVPPGCYVVKGVTGHFFTVDADRFAATYEPAGEPLALPPDEPAATGAVARMFGAVVTKPCGCGPDEPCGAHAEAGPPDDTTRALTAAPDGTRERTGAVLPLDRESLRGIVGNAVADWWTAPAPSEKIADALWPLLEHMQSAAAGSHEGVRLWMLDCGELAAKHLERAGYWRKRWTAACERADEDGRQAVSQHVRILELEQRAEAAEAKLAEVRSTVTAFLGHYGNSTAASFQQALDLAHGVLQVLDRAPLGVQERGGGEGAGQ